MQPGVTQLGEGPGALGQHGCAEETGAGIEVQTPFGVNRRRAAIRMARPKYLLAVMIGFTALPNTTEHVSV
jgi:hypothetical protein